jgi:hypothetical protein
VDGECGFLSCKVRTVDYPRHSKTRSSALRGLLDGLITFRELEVRISGLPGKRERGDAFEVFAEAYLATVAIERAKHVWPGANVPNSLRKQLALTIGDKGVDGIFQTQLGEYHAYQVKFRTGRPSLSWDELSTFIGLADRVKQRVLFTNCDRFADVDQNRAKVASSPVTDAGGNLWTCYQQLKLFVTSTLANLFEIADRRSRGST